MLLAVLFVGSGLLTYQIYRWISKNKDDYQFVYQLVTGLPFGMACSFRLMGQRKWIVPTVILDCITWVVAYRLGLALAGSVNPYPGMAIAGMVGGLGVTLATGLGRRTLYSWRTFAGAALVGAIAGLPFGLVLNRSAKEDLILAICFPLWQIAVGMWIAVRSGLLPDRS
jgi:hypothetical protein